MYLPGELIKCPGGTKESGLGREGICFAMEDMTEIRLMVIRTLPHLQGDGGVVQVARLWDNNSGKAIYMKNSITIFIITLCMGFMIVSVSMPADTNFDNSLYADLLYRYVKKGVVNYGGFKTEEKKLDAYLKMLESADTKEMSKNEQFAFYINAYNAWTIKLILSDYPGIKSIKDLGFFFITPWNKKICRIDGKILTLDDIENKILRGKFKDPRVHFTIVCASKGCPLLISKPYQGSIIDKQLDEAARAFINNRGKNYMAGNTLYVNSIFKWFSKDFNNDIVSFFKKYATGALKKQLSAGSDNIKIKYLYYDWSLNGY